MKSPFFYITLTIILYFHLADAKWALVQPNPGNRPVGGQNDLPCNNSLLPSFGLNGVYYLKSGTNVTCVVRIADAATGGDTFLTFGGSTMNGPFINASTPAGTLVTLKFIVPSYFSGNGTIELLHKSNVNYYQCLDFTAERQIVEQTTVASPSVDADSMGVKIGFSLLLFFCVFLFICEFVLL